MDAKPFSLKKDYLGEELYKTLGINTPRATESDIKKAYRKLQRETHTDSVRGLLSGDELDPFIVDSLDKLSTEISYAYEILSHADTREFYDLHRTAFENEIATRRNNRKDEVEQRRADVEEARRRIKVIVEASDANAEKRNAAETKQRELQKLREGLRGVLGKEEELNSLTQQIEDLTREIEGYDKPARDLNAQFKQDTEEKRAEREKEKPKESLKDFYRSQWMGLAGSAQRFENLANNPPPDATEDDISNWRQQAEKERKQSREFKEKFEDELRKEREASSGTKTEEGKSTGSEGSASGGNTGGTPNGEGVPGGETGADDKNGKQPPGFGFGGETPQEPPRGNFRDWFRSRYDKFQRGRRESQQEKSQERVRKDKTKAEQERIKQEQQEQRDRENQAQQEKNAQEERQRREEKEQAKQARQAEREARDAQRTQAERDRQDTEQSSVLEEEGERVAAAARRAARAEGAVPPTEEETTGPAGEGEKVGAATGGGEAKG